MPTVSILIPAFKPDYLAKTLASACAQTFADIEILVGDDTPNARLRDIVEGIGDPRVRYFHHGFGDGLRNQEALWARCSGKYVKWLYDDDLLLAGSVATLVAALELHPESALAFHERLIIGPDDKILDVPASLIPAGETACLPREFLVQHLVADVNNFIGEPSNVMLVRERVDIASMATYRSRKLAYLTDVAMYLNVAEQGPLVIVGGHHSCFRRHPAQNSSNSGPELGAGFYEWEIMVRGEAAAGHLSADALQKAKARLKTQYTFAIEKRGLAGLAALRDNLDELGQLPPAELPESPRFHVAIAQSRATQRLEMSAVAARARPAKDKKDKLIRFVCATRGSHEQFFRQSALGRSLKPYSYLDGPEDVQISVTDNNTRGLPAIYNAAIDAAATNPAILVFVHDDVWLGDFFYQQRIREALDRFDVVGIAGNTRRVPRQPTWSSTSLGFEWDLGYLSGTVGHGNGLPYEKVNVYGPAAQECKLLDGVMLIADSEKLIANGVRFDERFDFHFYDLDFCRQAELNGLKMGTWPLSVVHEGMSSFGTDSWLKGYARYMEKYGEEA